MKSQRMYSGSSVRKTWHLYDAGKGSTHRLRYQLAEDGCKESQFAVAKGLLREYTNSAEERRVNAEIAVYWLVQAANQGHDEAIDLLDQCYQNGTGITLLNRAMVEKCLNNSENEKLANKVGHSIYKAITIDCCDEALPLEMFQERTMHLISKERKKQTEEIIDTPFPASTANSVGDQDSSKTNWKNKVTPLEIIASVKQCLDGELPLVAFKSNTAVCESTTLIFRIITAPWLFFQSCVEAFIEGMASSVPPVTVLLMSLAIVGLSIALLPTSLLLSGHLFNFGLLTLCLISLLTMISSSCYVILLNVGFYSVCKWLHLVKLFDPAAQIDKVEKKYLRKKMLPLLGFFGSAVIFVVTYPFLSTKIPRSDFAILALLLMVWTNKTATSHTVLVKVSLALNALLCLYKGRVFETSSFGWLFGFDFEYNISLSHHFHINLSTVSCISFVLIALYISMALKHSQGGKLLLLPHLMTVIWLNLATVQLKDSQISELINSTIFWSATLVVSKLTASFPVFMIMSSIKYALSQNINWSLLFMIILLFSICLCLSIAFIQYLKTSLKVKTGAFIILMLMLSTVLLQLTFPHEGVTTLPWDQYQSYCHRPAWDVSNVAEVEMACLPLKGQNIAAEGTISSINIISMENYLQHVTNFLPSPLSNWVSCAFGKPYPQCNDTSLSTIEKDRCLLFQGVGLKGCHLEDWNIPKFEITLEVSARFSPELYLTVDEHCKNFITVVKEGDTIQTVGSLVSNIGGLKPRIHLKRASCLSCYDEVSCEFKLPSYSIDWIPSLRNFVFVFLSPIIQNSENESLLIK